MNSEQRAIRSTIFSLIGNASLAAIKGAAGVFGNSYALVADAIESLTDIVSSTLLAVGIRYAVRPADARHPYGHGGVEALVTFATVGVMIAAATLIAVEAVRHIGTPHAMPEWWTLVVLAVVIVWKELSFRYVRRTSERTHSAALAADAWHHRSDAISSLAAFVGIAAAIWLGPGHEDLDDWAALVAAGMIVVNAFRAFRPALGEIMDENSYDELVEQIRDLAGAVPGVADTEKCFVRKSGMRFHVDLHAIVDGGLSVSAGHAIAHRIQGALREELPQLGRVSIHVEPVGVDHSPMPVG